jgi:fatty acid desaturase
MHHLFPQICHVHLGRLQPIVAEVAKEYGITYHTASYLDAYRTHFRALRRLGAHAVCPFPVGSVEGARSKGSALQHDDGLGRSTVLNQQ